MSNGGALPLHAGTGTHVTGASRVRPDDVGVAGEVTEPASWTTRGGEHVDSPRIDGKGGETTGAGATELSWSGSS